MGHTDDDKHVATACLQAWTTGDFERARALLHDDVTFVGPLGKTEGGDEYINGVRGFAELVRGVDIHEVIAENGQVCVMYDLVTKTAGAIPTVGWYEVRDDKVASVRAFFDPRPLTS
jgi:ketosteroid isomerase-like protein